MAGSLDFPFGTGLPAAALSAGVQVKLDATVDPNLGIAVATTGTDAIIGVVMYNSNNNTLLTPIKLYYNTYLGNLTGGLVTRGTSLYTVTGGLFSPVSGGQTAVAGYAGQGGTTGDEIEIYQAL